MQEVTFADGARGTVTGDGADGYAAVRVEGAGTVLVPTDLLTPTGDGRTALSLRAADLGAGTLDVGDSLVIPVMEEFATVGKRSVVTGRVRVTKTVQESEEVVDVPLARTEVEVTRVPRGHLVAEAPALRQEGDTLIVSVVEEVLVVERRLRLVEEIHLTGTQTEYRAPQAISLRREEVTVERLEAETGATVGALP